MFFKDGFFWGMHLIWWAIWLVALGWIFFAPSNWPFPEEEEDDTLVTLKRRFAKGEINKQEYEDSKQLLKSDN
ncbi:putative membrane protein [Maribacter dokdonensis]|uniref:SHOCT domain-containing protein n=1 Tax=Maribacter dokdonensis TaxID=320912 RepID=UPI001B002548|nr:SHOCT domain-containing protein [Maribacter dokdonensis]CAG2533115.1 putative membrane protein [Maribacter dokdonensis]